MSRSEDSEWIPVLIGAAAGILGLGWFILLNTAKGAKATIKRKHYAFVFVAAAVVGVFAVENAYRAQDVWTFSDNWMSAAIAAFTGATTGSMGAALAVLWPEPKDD